jgi:hypothetical protein
MRTELNSDIFHRILDDLDTRIEQNMGDAPSATVGSIRSGGPNGDAGTGGIDASSYVISEAITQLAKISAENPNATDGIVIEARDRPGRNRYVFYRATPATLDDAPDSTLADYGIGGDDREREFNGDDQ